MFGPLRVFGWVWWCQKDHLLPPSGTLALEAEAGSSSLKADRR